MRYIIILLVFLCNINTIVAQDFQDIIDKVTNKYENTKSYESKVKYTLYEDSISKVVKDQLYGKLYKDEDNYHLKIKTSEIVKAKDFYLKISHSEKMLQYSKTNKGVENNTDQTPFITLIDQFEDKQIKDKGELWELVFTKKKKASPYNKIIIHISKKGYNVVKQVYYLSASYEKKYDSNATNTKKERLEIIEVSFKENPKRDNSVFNLSKYLINKDNKYTLSSYLEGYKIIF
ncbi:hypothetical protein [uncultured Lacinutrix sp.]|uniref:LolA family protein n=1 Tax=uncultured Lacinutrix sp. TaxID=574032 RepID=UPI0026222FC9|nr:hypothetical protein [uncultured Lacinutrix sp.]